MSGPDDIDTASGATSDGISRRRMIGATAAGGAAIWVAPAVAGVATGAAHGTPVPCPDCGGAEATALSVAVGTLVVGPLGQDTTNDGGEPVCVLDPAIAQVGLRASTVCGHVTSSCSAESFVEQLALNLGTLNIPLSLGATVLRSDIQVGDGDDCCAVEASTTITQLAGDLNGQPLNVAVLPNPGPNTVLASADLPLAGNVRVIANRQVCEGNEAVVQALYISVTDGLVPVEIVIGESRVTMPENCPCPFPAA